MTNQEAMAGAIKARINGDKNHGWGVEDSLFVILSIVANELGAEVSEYQKDEGKANFADLIKSTINPSQFRQILEGKGILAKSEKKERTKNAIDDLLNSL